VAQQLPGAAGELGHDFRRRLDPAALAHELAGVVSHRLHPPRGGCDWVKDTETRDLGRATVTPSRLVHTLPNLYVAMEALYQLSYVGASVNASEHAPLRGSRQPYCAWGAPAGRPTPAKSLRDHDL
jgi:hypothetical protein